MRNLGCIALRIAALLYLFVALPAPVVAQGNIGCAEPGPLATLRADHLDMLNAIRKRQEVGVLANNEKLNSIAQAYACTLARTGHFDHVGPDGSTLSERVRKGGYNFCVVAENLARGQSNVTGALRGWITSEGHWRNMKRQSLTEVGFGAAASILVADDKSVVGGLSSLARSVSQAHQKADRNRPVTLKGPIVWVQVFGRPC